MHGRRKVLFGTNFPMLLHGKCLGDLECLGLDEETTRFFLYENAARIFGIQVEEVRWGFERHGDLIAAVQRAAGA